MNNETHDADSAVSRLLADRVSAPAEERGWTRFLTERDREIFAGSGFGRKMSLGRRPAVIVVDMTNGFCGDRREPIEQSIKRYRTSCGEAAWDSLEFVNRICRQARSLHYPVMMTTGSTRRIDGLGRGLSSSKTARAHEDPPDFYEFANGLERHESDITITKSKPSAFHGTPLPGMLVELGIDSLIICGATTSGCVRATVVDAFSYNYPVIVPEDATVDRGQVSHWISLFDIDMKYATVLSSDRVLDQMAEVAHN